MAVWRLWDVRKSAIHGYGVFAIKRIFAGSALARVPSRNVFRTALPESFRAADGNFLFDAILYWMNHSCDPNAIVKQSGTSWIVRVQRDIATGEELTYDYGLKEPTLPCRCGAKACKGSFTARSER